MSPPPDKLLARPAQGADPILVLAVAHDLVGHRHLFGDHFSDDAGKPFRLPQRLDLGTRCELRDGRRRDAEALEHAAGQAAPRARPALPAVPPRAGARAAVSVPPPPLPGG